MKPVAIDIVACYRDGVSITPSLPTALVIKYPEQEAVVHCFGQATFNNSTFDEARAELVRAVSWRDGIVGYNLKEVLKMMEYHFGLPRLEPTRVYDLSKFAYLYNPDSDRLHFDELVEDYAPLVSLEYTQRLYEAMTIHRKFWNMHLTARRSSSGDKGKYVDFLGFANGYDMGKYLKERAMAFELMFKKLYSLLEESDMLAVYYKEVELMYSLIDNELQGIRVDVDKLEKDIEEYELILSRVDDFLKAFLNDKKLNLNDKPKLINRLIQLKLMNLDKLHTNKRGDYAYQQDDVWRGCQNRVLGAMLKYRMVLYLGLNTYMKRWRKIAKYNGGRLKINWVQGRIAEQGARTGRLTTHPNMQGIPYELSEDLFRRRVGDGLPAWPLKKIEYKKLPNLRAYILPDSKDHLILSRDYSQQELRIIIWQGRYNNTRTIYEALKLNNWLDVYEFMQSRIRERTELRFTREQTKIIILSTLYGMRANNLAKELGIEVWQAQSIQQYIYSLFFSGLGLDLGANNYKMAGRPYYTIAGRRYFDKALKSGRGLSSNNEYKYFNTIIQGSGADIIKDAIIRFDKLVAERGLKDKMRLMLSIHDELVVSCHKDLLDEGMELMAEAMESGYSELVLKTEGEVGKNFGELTSYDKKGVVVFGGRV